MAHNQRIFYACQAVAITSRGAGSVATTDIVYGAQSVGMSSTFTLDQVFELGQIEIYENVEEVADIEVTIEKVIDGEKLVFHMASGGACKTDLVAASKNRCDVLVAVFDDGLSHGTGVPRSVCYNSGMFTSSVSYSYSVDGSATESVTLVGNDRFWNANKGGTTIHATPTAIWGASNPTQDLDGTDVPKSGVVRRVGVDLEASTLPAEVKSQMGNDATGIGGGYHVQSVTVSTDFGQENIQ